MTVSSIARQALQSPGKQKLLGKPYLLPLRIPIVEPAAWVACRWPRRWLLLLLPLLLAQLQHRLRLLLLSSQLILQGTHPSPRQQSK